MATLEDQVGGKCQLRFKGIENFLRRVAFNLGNSPSQTEVKIISCIPIDVTDLQHKIIQLEKQLEEVTSRSKTPPSPAPAPIPTVVNTALGPGEFKTRCECIGTDHCDCQTPCQDGSERSTALSFIIPSVLSQGVSTRKLVRVHQKKQSPWTSPICYETEQAKRNIFRKHKKAKKPEHLIYYAETTGSPFTNYKREVAARKETQKTVCPIDRPHVKDLIRKQYGREMHRHESSSSSALTAPVCRDAAARAPVARDSDLCSCCHGLFHDLDLDLDHRPYRFLDATLPTTMTQNIDNGNVYYNSSYYDIIPVKEKPDKTKRETEQLTKRDPKTQFQGNCWPENHRTKTDCRSLMTNYTLPSPTRCMKKMPVKYAKRRDRPAKRIEFKNDSSRNTVDECGDVYMKRSVAKNPRPKFNKPVLLKNAECLTHNVNHTECQTETLKDTQPEMTAPIEENKTESTLNQIKSILQSVLTHVKTTNLVKSQIEEKGRKDAVVQNEGQCRSQERSRLLNSFTYSPFAMDPYMASCSRALSSNHCIPCPVVLPQAADLHPMVPQSHYKCMQNFPVFIQHRPACLPRPQCPSCCPGGGLRNPAGQPKQTSTNALPNEDEKRSKETENLIKDIYKSMALNMNIPSKDTSQSDYSCLKASDVSRNQSGEPVISNVMTVGHQMRSRGHAEKARQQSPVSTSMTSRATSSTRTPVQSPPGDQRSLRRYLANKSNVHDSDTTTETLGQKKARQVEATTSTSNDTTSESETESEDSIVTVQKTVKKESAKVGLLSKMFGSVFKKRRRKMKREFADTAEPSEASDSDDYQTVYSQKVEKPKHVTYAPSFRQRSKRSLRPREWPRREPYMEQEERRHWNEELTFHARQAPRQALERAPVRPPPRGVTIRTRAPGIHFQKLEARPVLVDQPNPPYSRPQFDPPRSTLQAARKARSPRLSVGLKGSNKRISWLKRYSPRIQCGEQWKRILLEG